MLLQVQEFYQKFNGGAPVYTVTERKTATADQRFLCTLIMPEGSPPGGAAAVGSPFFEEQAFQAAGRNKKGCTDAAAKLGLAFLNSQQCYHEMIKNCTTKHAGSGTPATLLQAVILALSGEVRLRG